MSVLPVAVPALGRQAPGAEQAAPGLHVTTRLVQVGVTVHDKNGAVPGLTKNDFSIFDRGTRQEIQFFSVIPAGGPAATAASVESLPPNTFSDLPKYNPAAPGSITIVLLDNLNTLYGSSPTSYEETPYWMEDHALANAKAHLLEYLKHLKPQDRVAIYGLRESLYIICDFSSDRERLLAIVKNYDPRSQTSREMVAPVATHTPQGMGPDQGFDQHINLDRLELAAMKNEDRAVATMAALRAIADHAANIPVRKNLVWLTANLPFSAQAIARILGPAQMAAYPVDGRGLLARSQIKTLRDGISGDELIYGKGPSEQSPDPTGIDVMIRLADLTGGKAFVNSNDLTGAIREAVDDASVLYVLGFYIDAKSADDKFHELKVDVKPAGLRVRYPKGYFAYKDAPSTQDEILNNWVTALRSPIESSAIPVEAKIERVNVPAPNTLDIHATIDVHPVRLEEKRSVREGAVDVVIVVQDAAGKVVSRSVNRLALRMTPEQYAAALATGVRFEKHVEPQAGAATLRILVQDPGSAQVGTLIIPLSQIQ